MYNYVHLALVAVKQKLERMEVVGIDEQMPWLLRSTSFNTVKWHKRRVNRVTKATHNHKVRDGNFFV